MSASPRSANRVAPLRVRRTKAKLVIALAGLAAVSCTDRGGDERSAGAQPAPAVTSSASSAPTTPSANGGGAATTSNDGPLHFAFARTDLPAPEWDVENRSRLDPNVDGWPTEAFHDRARPRLDALLRRACGVGAEGPALEDLLDEEFAGASVLRPELVDVFSKGGCRVSRPVTLDPKLLPPAELAAQFAALEAALAGAPPRIEAQIESVDAVEGGYRTHVRWSAGAIAANGAVQVNAQWNVVWRDRGDKAPPTVRSIELASFEEARTPRALFGDRTGLLLSAAPEAVADFREGLAERHFRNDQLTGNALLGGQGLAVGDVNGDGLEDVYVPMQGGTPNRLLLARADGTVVDGAQQARVAFLDNTRSALIVDLDNDGARDLVLAIYSNVVVAYNDGHGVFVDQAVLRAPGVEDIFSITAADPDGDGDLDLYCCRYVQGGMIAGVPTPYHDAQNGASNVFWRNDGRGRFTDATDAVGLGANNAHFSLAALWEDIDDDGDQDLYVANDFGRNNLYRNDGGRFVDIAAAAGAEDMAAGMGATVADFDLDGELDLYVSNMYAAAGLRVASQSERFLGGKFADQHAHYEGHARGNTLLRGLGGARFEDVTERMGVGAAGWAWGAMFVDFDGDGYEDLFSPNGFITGGGAFDVDSFFWRRVINQSPQDAAPTEAYRQAWGSMQRMVMEEDASYNGFERDTAFLNLDGKSFADVSLVTGLDALSDSRAVARIDWDDDGRLDMLVKSRTAPRLRLMRNQHPAPQHFLVLDLVGTSCNRDAIGARAKVELEGRTLRKTLHGGEGYLAQSSHRLHFGLGAAERAARVEVRWPDGAVESFENLAADSRYRIVQGAGEVELVAPRKLESFESAAPSPLAPPDGLTTRVPLVERMPMDEYAFVMLDGAVRKVREFAGAPLIVTLWSATGPQCREELVRMRDLARERGTALHWIAATLDQGPDLLAARKLANELGIAKQAALLDPHAAKLIELQFLLVLGRSQHVPTPTSMLLDPAGQWTIAYLGPTRRDVLVSDLAVVERLDSESRGSSKLIGGRWLARGKRDYAFLAGICRDLGANDLAEFYGQIASGESK